MTNPTSATPTACSLHEHEAFDVLTRNLEFIQLGIAALKGLGAMMQPETDDHQMNPAFSSDAAAVFHFFGEALEEAANKSYNAKERLESAMKSKIAIQSRGGHHG